MNDFSATIRHPLVYTVSELSLKHSDNCYAPTIMYVLCPVGDPQISATAVAYLSPVSPLKISEYKIWTDELCH